MDVYCVEFYPRDAMLAPYVLLLQLRILLCVCQNSGVLLKLLVFETEYSFDLPYCREIQRMENRDTF